MFILQPLVDAGAALGATSPFLGNYDDERHSISKVHHARQSANILQAPDDDRCFDSRNPRRGSRRALSPVEQSVGGPQGPASGCRFNGRQALDLNYQASRQAGVSEAEALERSKALLRKLRYGKDDYFYAFNPQGLVVAHIPLPGLHQAARILARKRSTSVRKTAA